MSIPVRNIWWLMLYASDLGKEAAPSLLAAEDLPEEIPDLVAEILARAVEQRQRRQLSTAFRQREAVLSRVRGRIDHLSTARRQLLAQGRIACRFEELTVDSPRNRYVRTALETVARLVHNPALAHRPSWQRWPHQHLGHQRGACTGGWRLVSMPIPGFNEYGLLDDGTYACTMREVEAALAWNEHRRRLTESLQAFIRDELLDRFTTIPPLVLDGSYVTSEEQPANINLVIELRGLPSDQQWGGQMLYVRYAEIFDTYKIDMRPSLERIEQGFVACFRSCDPRKALEGELDCTIKKGLLRLMS